MNWGAVFAGFKGLTALGTGVLVGGGAATVMRSRERQQAIASGSFFERQGDFYQVVGHAWDHSRRDFCVVFRPLWHCEAKPQGHEAHVMAAADFEHFNEYRQVGYEEMTIPAQNLALPGPFWRDDSWALPAETARAEGPTSSGLGTRSHQARATKRLLE